MKHIIRANTLTAKRYLKVEPTGVTFYEAKFIGGKRRFSFGEIDSVLMSENWELSFQVRNEVFRLPTDPRQASHQATINALIQGIGWPT